METHRNAYHDNIVRAHGDNIVISNIKIGKLEKQTYTCEYTVYSINKLKQI